MMRIAIAAFLFGANAAGAAGNLLVNGDFSQVNQLNGWSCFGSTSSGGSWSNNDSAGVSSSGSLQHTVLGYDDFGTVAGDTHCITACMSVTPGAVYILGGLSKESNPANIVTYSCYEWGNNTCSGTENWRDDVDMGSSSVWHATTSTATLAIDTLSVLCRTELDAAVLGSATANFDRLFFTPDTVFANGFEP